MSLPPCRGMADRRPQRGRDGLHFLRRAFKLFPSKRRDVGAGGIRAVVDVVVNVGPVDRDLAVPGVRDRKIQVETARPLAGERIGKRNCLFAVERRRPFATQQTFQRGFDHGLLGAVEIDPHLAGVLGIGRPDANDAAGAVHLREHVPLRIHGDGRTGDVALDNLICFGPAVSRGGVGPDIAADSLMGRRNAHMRSGGEVPVGRPSLLGAGFEVRRFGTEHAVVEHEAAVAVGEPAFLAGRFAASIVAAELFRDKRRIGILGKQRQIGHLRQQGREIDPIGGGSRISPRPK